MSRRGNGEGSIYRDGDRWIGALYVRDHLGRTVKRKFTGRSRKEVAARLAAAKEAADRHLPVGDPKLTTGAFLDQWLRDSAAPALRPRTHESYAMIVRVHLKPAIGHIPLLKLSPADVQAYMASKRADGLSARTTQYHHSVLRRALHIAEAWGAVPRNVARLATPPRVERGEVSPFTPEQARSFLQAVRGDRLAALYTVAIVMGLRQGELLGLRWDDVDFERTALSIRHTLQKVGGEFQLAETKTAKSRRTLAMPAPVVAALRSHRSRQAEERLWLGPAWQGEAMGLVFTDEAGDPMSDSRLRKAFARIVKEAGLPKQRFHDLRHAAATYMLTQGVPLRVAMEVLGHSQIHVTANTYSHVMPELKREAAERVGGLLFGS
ncbi:MAG: site-specific integrase [Chloroflexi bacterium CFX7]|nr:site-specific integrase [Chloroflexi bacterium CFX7]MCK6564168.1 site-specific integrase [Dehalococcoidia bacterium]RIL02105.1 MAG: site-specific integrase [bacterium]